MCATKAVDDFSEMEITSEIPYLTQEESFMGRMLETGLLFDKYYTPLLCLFGAFGNSLSLVVFCMDGKYRRQSSSYYLSALAVSDSGFLLNLFAVWLESVMGGVITSHLTCPLVMYLGQVTCFMSVYFTLGFSLERYIAVNFPFSRPRICTRSKAKKVIAAVVTVALLAFSYAWFIAKVIEIPTPSSPSQICDNILVAENDSMEWTTKSNVEYLQEEFSSTFPNIDTINLRNLRNSSCNEPVSGHDTINYMCTVPERYYKISEIANYLDSGVTFIIPFLLITFFNVSIARSVWKLNTQRQYIMASMASTLNPTMILTSVSSNSRNVEQQIPHSNKKINGSIKVVKNPLDRDETNEVVLSLQPRRMKNGSLYNSGRNILCENENFYKQNASFAQRQKINGSSSGSYQYQQQQKQQQPLSSEVRVTKTLLLVSTVFLVLNLPLHAIRCTQFIQAATGTPERQDILQALQPWANMLFNTNFAVNFFLYCVSGSNFRKSVRNITKRVFRNRKPNLTQPIYNHSLRRG